MNVYTLNDAIDSLGYFHKDVELGQINNINEVNKIDKINQNQ